jgi:hypothetical protein
MAEAVRHNRQIEKVEKEQKKLESMEWQRKSDQLSFKVDLVKHYIGLKSGFSDKQIVRLLPEMKAVVAAFEDSGSYSED